MTCKDCLHIEVCAYIKPDLPICSDFADRSKYVVREKGEWKPYIEDVEIYNTGGFTEKRQTGWICGKCKSKKSITQYYPTDFCPNCGSDMRKEENDSV